MFYPQNQHNCHRGRATYFLCFILFCKLHLFPSEPINLVCERSLCEGSYYTMGKSCRVKYQTRTFKKRGKVFRKKVSEDVNDVDNKEEEAIVNIVNNDTVESTPNREEPDPETTPKKTNQTVSERKVEHIISATPKSIDPISGYRIIDIELLN